MSNIYNNNNKSMLSNLFPGASGASNRHNGYMPAMPNPDKNISPKDQLQISPQANSMSYMRAQFQVEYSVTRMISGENGQSILEKTQFNFQASIEMLNIQQGPKSEAPRDMNTLIDQLREMFTPEKVSGRILDFALAQYSPKGEDTEQARKEFADYIGGFIQKGFDEAQKILGAMPDFVQNEINKTHELTFAGFDQFVSQGLPEDQQERTASVLAWKEVFDQSFTFTETEGKNLQYHIYDDKD